MGNSKSQSGFEENFIIKQWNTFEKNCIVYDASAYTEISHLAALFATQLCLKYPSNMELIHMADIHIKHLINHQFRSKGIVVSAGWTQDKALLDHRLLIGIRMVPNVYPEYSLLENDHMVQT